MSYPNSGLQPTAFDTDRRWSESIAPIAHGLYKTIWPGCRITRLSSEGVADKKDQHFAIDVGVSTPDGKSFTMQEKFRRGEHFARFGHEFTQEHMNGNGSPGEWFHLCAEAYFYGWFSESTRQFFNWYVLDVKTYKSVVEQYGGLESIGYFRKNRDRGSASFYAIDVKKHLLKAVIAASWREERQLLPKQLSLTQNILPPKEQQLTLFGTQAEPCERNYRS